MVGGAEAVPCNRYTGRMPGGDGEADGKETEKDMEVKIRIKDLGFGEIFKSSDKTWEYMMSLETEQ